MPSLLFLGLRLPLLCQFWRVVLILCTFNPGTPPSIFTIRVDTLELVSNFALGSVARHTENELLALVILRAASAFYITTDWAR
jgi:hypothetical protein